MRGRMFSFMYLFSVVFFFVGESAEAVTTEGTGTTNSNATVGFIGVLIGSLITGAATWLAVRENRKLQWSLAALDKRLAVHQEAYSEWKKIMRAVCGGEDIFNTVLEAEKWWNNNCLYLDPVSRQAFRECVLCVFKSQECLEKTQYKDFMKRNKETWNQIMRPGQTIPEGVALGHFEEKELSFEHTSRRE